jgi:uncharacterized damage-inducible protein DinB
MSAPWLQALIAHFDSIFEGPNGDYPAVLEALSGVSAARALWKPSPDANSIWQITDHVTASKHWQVEMLEKSRATAPAWIEPKGGEAEWQTALAKLKEAHAQLKAALVKVPEHDLLGMPLPDWKSTQLELLLSIAAHEAFHAGQIDYLKGLQAEQTPS